MICIRGYFTLKGSIHTEAIFSQENSFSSTPHSLTHSSFEWFPAHQLSIIGLLQARPAFIRFRNRITITSRGWAAGKTWFCPFAASLLKSVTVVNVSTNKIGFSENHFPRNEISSIAETIHFSFPSLCYQTPPRQASGTRYFGHVVPKASPPPFKS